MAENFQQLLLKELSLLLEPVLLAVKTPAGRTNLLLRVGWREDNLGQDRTAAIATALNNFASDYDTKLLPLLANPPKTLKDLPTALGAADAVVKTIVAVSQAVTDPDRPPGIQALGEDLLGLSIVEYLRNRSPALEPLFILLTLLREHDVFAVTDASGLNFIREPHRITSFEPGRVIDLIQDPAGELKQEYLLESGLTQPDATADKLFPRIANLAQALGLPFFFGFDPLDGVNLGTPFGNDRARHMLTVFVPVTGDVIDTSGGFGVGLALDADLGLVVKPIGTLAFDAVVGRWAFHLSSGASLPAFAVGKNGLTIDPASTASDVRVHLDVVKLPPLTAADQQTLPAFLIGSETGTRLEIQHFRAGFDAAFAGPSREFGFLLQARKGALVLESDDGDGFMGKVFPKSSRIDFDLGIGWSNQTGLYFQGSAALEVSLPVNFEVAGVLTVSAVNLALRAVDSGDLEAQITANASVHIGPVTASVEKLGLRTTLTPAGSTDHPQSSGNLGPFEASLGFRFPSGIGIAIDAGPVAGGGFLAIDLDAGRYGGSLELRIFEITLKAFGVIDTKMPDGSRGFSFVIVISAEFQPIQLGLGFTLNGVGGLLGINRTLSEQELTAVLSTKNADSILFPRNLTQNAPQIIEALATIFPPDEGNHVFGPMAKLGWGTPTLVVADLAVVLRLPEKIIHIIGLLTAALPKKEGDDSAALVDLHMFVVGTLDIPGKSFSLDADLHDSTVGGYAVSGKMATRLRWGERPNFLISMGGFHSNFQPPPEVPKLERLKVALGITGNPTIELSGFLAVTSNTVQVGGELRFDAHKFGFDVGASVSAEAIFIFAPFSFDAVIEADVHVTFHGVGFTVRMHGHLSGPSPWHVDAKVCASLWFVSACLPISVTIGDRGPETLPELDPWVGSLEPAGTPKAVIGLRDALEDARNWTPQPGKGTLAVVSRVEPTVAAGALPPTLIDPLDAITVHQRTVPLETKAPIRRFGPVRSSGTETYHLVSATIDAAELTLQSQANVEDQFAPGQFFEIDRTKIVSASSFERHKAGYTLDPGADRLEGSGETTETGVSFETYVVDTKRPTRWQDLDELLRAGLLDGMLRAGPASVSGLFGKGTGTFVDLAAPGRFDFKDPRYRVTDKATRQPVTTVTPDTVSKLEALVILEQHLTQNPANRGRYQVSRVDPTVAA